MRILGLTILALMCANLSCGPKNNEKLDQEREPEKVYGKRKLDVLVLPMTNHLKLAGHEMDSPTFVLGHGVLGGVNGENYDFSQNPCVRGETGVLTQGSVTSSYGSFTDATELYRLISIYGEQKDEQLSNFVFWSLRNEKRGEATLTAQYKVTHGYSRVAEPKPVLNECKTKSGKSTQFYISTVSYGSSLAYTLKVQMASQEKLKEWEKQFGESPAHSLFSSQTDIATIQAAIRKYEIRNLEFRVLQLGGDFERSSKLIENLDCSTENIEGCRKILRALGKGMAEQIPELNIPNLPLLEPVSVSTQYIVD